MSKRRRPHLRLVFSHPIPPVRSCPNPGADALLPREERIARIHRAAEESMRRYYRKRGMLPFSTSLGYTPKPPTES